MASDRRRRRWLPLLLDVVLATLFLLLDMRDLWFKLRWVGPRDAFAFSTVETRSFPASTAAPLKPTTSFSYADQKSQRVSGWSSFLQQCELLTALPEDEQTRGFQFVLGKNCMIGNAVRAQEMILTSSIRVDAMAWTACELLYKNRKPPICHSPIVTQFRERYNIQNEHVNTASTGDTTKGLPETKEGYAAVPGSEAESELIDLLEVISKSSPLSAAVCVEGFIVKGPGRYTTSVYGCGSPSFYRSVLVGPHTPTFLQFQRDKAWLSTDLFSVGGMTFLVRENRLSVYTVHDSSTETGNRRVLAHLSFLNISTSGVLYTAMILVDLALLVLGIWNVFEITRFMLWPLWKPLVASEYQTSSTRTTKMGFAIEDYAQVLQVGSLRSTPVALLVVLSRLLSWVLIAPSVMSSSDGKFDSGDVHVFLMLIRAGDLAALCVNALWDIVVFCDERFALLVVRNAYASLLEIRCVGAAVIAVVLVLFTPHIGARYRYDRQRLIDRSSFENVTAVANTLPSEMRNPPSAVLFEVYYPLFVIVGAIMCTVGLVVVLRYSAGAVTPSRSLVQSVSEATAAVQPSTTKESPTRKLRDDLTSSSAGILMRSLSPPPSPKREVFPFAQSINRPDTIDVGRLAFENQMDIPIRARSLIRTSWALEMMAEGQLLLLPTSYLEFGIMLNGRFMKTRCGFMDVVQPLVHVREHGRIDELEEEHQAIQTNSTKSNLR